MSVGITQVPVEIWKKTELQFVTGSGCQQSQIDLAVAFLANFWINHDCNSTCQQYCVQLTPVLFYRILSIKTQNFHIFFQLGLSHKIWFWIMSATRGIRIDKNYLCGIGSLYINSGTSQEHVIMCDRTFCSFFRLSPIGCTDLYYKLTVYGH